MARTPYSLKRRPVLLWFLRTRRRAAPFYPVPAKFGPLGRRAVQFQPTALLGARVAVSILAAAYLALAGFFPEGRNPLLGMETTSVFSYLKNFPVGDTLENDRGQSHRHYGLDC